MVYAVVRIDVVAFIVVVGNLIFKKHTQLFSKYIYMQGSTIMSSIFTI